MVMRRRGWLLIPLAATVAVLAMAEWRLERLQHHWPALREARIGAASGRLAGELRDARLLADSLARRALDLAMLAPEAGFAAVGSLVRGAEFESGLALFDSAGTAQVWGGRFRLLPAPTGDSVAVHLTPYYAVLEVRRHAASGHVAVAAVLLSAHPAVPDQSGSVAAHFRGKTEVGLEIVAPQVAPNSSDVYDYEQPTTGGSRVLFSVQFVPPEQRTAVDLAVQTGTRRVAWALLLTLIAAIWLVPAGILRVGVALLPFALALRAPLGALLGAPLPFDPGVFSSAVLGPVSRSAAPLAFAGVVLLLVGALLWERGPVRRPSGIVAGALLLVGAPYLMSEVGRGIVPPSSGVSLGLWLVWHLTLFLFSAGLIMLAAALLRGRELPSKGWWAPVLGAALALTAAAVGVELWNARYGWHDLYTLLWLPALVLVTRPADRRATIFGIAVVAGSATALLTWGAEIEGRLAAARADMARLGDGSIPGAEPALRALGASLRAAPVPRSAPELYALWYASSLRRQGQPAVLGTWRPDGTPQLELVLDDLDLPRDLIGSKVRDFPAGDSIALLRLSREPAVHELLLVRRDSSTILTVAIGPRSALVPLSRLGRLLAAQSPHSPLYQLTLGPAPSSREPESGSSLALWRREGWLARGERTVTIGGVARDVYGLVTLGTRGMLAVRGTLVVILDVAVLSAVWWAAILLGGMGPVRPAWMPRLRSYEARLGAALAVFFLAPTVGFAAWGVGRLRAETRESRDRMIEQSLHDVVPAGGMLPAADSALSVDLRTLGDRVDAAFALYRSGVEVAGSTGGLIEALGLVGPLMDPEAYHRIALHGEAVASGDGPSRAVASRIGYRAVRLSDLGTGMLATLQVAADPVLRDRQRDLALLFLLVTLGGVAASLLSARAAARVLSRPVAELRRAALAFGRDEAAPPPALRPPLEFAPVFAAFEKMTEDVGRAREAQERVARIVAWGQMANQVAHEIKNPLTPMRLGVQHLRRVYHDGRTPIGPVLEDTTTRILAEIDRLDRIARSFSRFGAPSSERGPLEGVRLAKVASEVADLYRLEPGGVEITVEVADDVLVAARTDEVKETLVNLLENARHAGATNIWIRLVADQVRVEDNGCGIPPALLPMIFEPRFSTSTSGSGLGLPIVKRLVEGWGGTVGVESEEGRGTVVRLYLARWEADGPGSAPQVGASPVKAEE